MKFPLAASPFPPLQLSQQRCDGYERLASSLVRGAIDEYDNFVHVQRRTLTKTQWKAVKTRENLTIKTTYVHDELIDGRVLFQIKYPTEEDPFEFLALKWFAKAHPASVNAVVWPRDIVFIEGTGILRLPDGELIGYHLLQSVELPQCPELPQLCLMRCQFSSCFLFKLQTNGTVEVYMKSLVEPGGTIPDVVTVMSTANGLIGCWKSVWCAQNKKLSWMMKEAAAVRARTQEFEDQPVKMVVRMNAVGKCCALCVKKLPTFRSVITCGLCSTAICSRCRTARKLSYVRHTGE